MESSGYAYLSDLDTSLEAFKCLKTLFSSIKVLSLDKFIAVHGYIPDVFSIFVVTQEDSECEIHNNTLESFGNLQIKELQSAYLKKENPDLPKAQKSGMGYKCPSCAKSAWINPAKQKINCCAWCKLMYYV